MLQIKCFQKIFASRLVRAKSQSSCYIFINNNYTDVICNVIFDDHVEFKTEQMKKDTER